MPITPAAIRAAKEREESMNGEVTFAVDQAPQLAPAYKVYIFNIAAIDWPAIAKGSAGSFKINPCEPGEPYSPPLVLPSVVLDSYFIENEMKTHSVSGEFMAQDIVHPNVGANWSFGQNLDDLGVFWTRNNPPTEKEIATARAKMEATFRKLLQMATSIETTGKLEDITPLMRIAATYFGEDRKWNAIYKKLSSCPGCGDAVKEGIIKHSCGYIFDLDRAIIAGMVTPEQYKTIVEVRSGARQGKSTTKK